MLKSGLAAVLAFLGMVMCSPSYATPIGFNGYYDYSTWTSSETFGGPTFSSIDGTQQTLTLYEPNNNNSGGRPNEFDFSHTVASSGVVSFHWNFNWDIDACCSGLNFYVNSTLYNLANGYFGNPYNNTSGDASGTFSVAVNAGDVIKFGAFSADSWSGASTNTITSLDAPNSTSTPVPAALPLFAGGLGVIGLLARRRKRKAAAIAA